MASIEHLAPRPHFNFNTSKAEVKQQPHTAPTAQQRTSSYDQAVQMADDLSAVLAQFRRRADMEKRAPNSADPFERILEEEAEAKVETLLFIANAPKLSPQELMLQARAMFPDDSDLILILREIIRRRKLRNENTDVLEEVMQQVWAESNEKLCQAGMNVGIKAQIFSKKMAVTPWSLRDTYRQFLQSSDGEIPQYEQWVEQYGNGRRYLVAEFIETALVHDIQCHDPSCSREEFGALLNHVVNFKKVLSSDKAFMQVFLKGSKQNIKLETETLACWFDCLQRPFKIQKEISKNHLAQFVQRFNLPKPVLQQKLLSAIKLLDGDLFFDAEAKEILIEALLNLNIESTPAL